MSELGPEFAILPESELRRLLRKYTGLKAGPRPNDVSLLDIARECQATRYALKSILYERESNKTIGKIVRRRLSRFLMRVEAGLITKKDGKMIFHAEPTKEPESVHRVLFYPNGRPVVRIGVPRPMATNFPKFFKDDPLNNRGS